jgi:actin-related protein
MQRLVGEDIEEINNGALLNYMRPFDRGYLVNWQVQLEVCIQSFQIFLIAQSNYGLLL